ncbi:hypothetical protein I4U23_004068 [Adineta vaga]|nr:hypothetical protein I4U23_004068 [Adineta vaga]
MHIEIYYEFVFIPVGIAGYCTIPSSQLESCGYSVCNPEQSNKLNVHIVPHTYDDVGWL